MTKRIFRSICLVAISIFLVSIFLLMIVLFDYFSDVQKRQLRTQTALAAQGVSENGSAYFEGLDVSDCRITWIAADGTVLFDTSSDSSQMENHLKREEIQEASVSGMGESSRYSVTLMERSLYCAKLLPDGTFLRLAVSQNTLLTLILGMTQPILVIFLASVVFAFFLASRLSKRIVKPLNELNLEEPLKNEEYDELSPLLRRIDAQQRQIRRQSEELRQKQREFETVTQEMSEGIVLLNAHLTILSINPAAARLFGTDATCVGGHILSVCRNQELQELLNDAAKGNSAETHVTLGEEKYQLNAGPVIAHGEVSGIVLLLLNVTQKDKAEQLRREFSANVSHELKTVFLRRFTRKPSA